MKRVRNNGCLNVKGMVYGKKLSLSIDFLFEVRTWPFFFFQSRHHNQIIWRELKFIEWGLIRVKLKTFILIASELQKAIIGLKVHLSRKPGGGRRLIDFVIKLFSADDSIKNLDIHGNTLSVFKIHLPRAYQPNPVVHQGDVEVF